MATVERWGVYEMALQAPEVGNPFVEVQLKGRFRYAHREMLVDGFYDGGGSYRLRFMPDKLGEWSVLTESNQKELAGQEDTFTCTPPEPGNHGPVVVRDTFHFAYADGTPYFPFGSTCYAWVHQGDELEAQTLRTLTESPFNKIRMCVFPKDYAYNKNEPPRHPFEINEKGGWN